MIDDRSGSSAAVVVTPSIQIGPGLQVPGRFLVVKVGSVMVDSSLRTSLEKMKLAMKGAA